VLGLKGLKGVRVERFKKCKSVSVLKVIGLKPFKFFKLFKLIHLNTFPTILPTFAPMARILAIDYGTKRTGLAVTDPLQIIGSGLETVPTHQLLVYLQEYLEAEEVETILIGEPKHLDGNPTKLVPEIKALGRKIKKLYPTISIVYRDERFTSEMAKEVILKSGVKKKKRRDKSLVDKVAAAIILQEYLEETKY